MKILVFAYELIVVVFTLYAPIQTGRLINFYKRKSQKASIEICLGKGWK